MAREWDSVVPVPNLFICEGLVDIVYMSNTDYHFLIMCVIPDKVRNNLMLAYVLLKQAQEVFSSMTLHGCPLLHFLFTYIIVR